MSIAGFVIYFGYGIWNSNIEARYHDTTRQADGSKEAIVMDSKNVQVRTAIHNILPEKSNDVSFLFFFEYLGGCI